VDGPATFRALKKINPRVRTVLSSGYSLEDSVDALFDEGILAMIQKPYLLKDLAAVLAKVMPHISPPPIRGELLQ